MTICLDFMALDCLSAHWIEPVVLRLVERGLPEDVDVVTSANLPGWIEDPQPINVTIGALLPDAVGSDAGLLLTGQRCSRKVARHVVGLLSWQDNEREGDAVDRLV